MKNKPVTNILENPNIVIASDFDEWWESYESHPPKSAVLGYMLRRLKEKSPMGVSQWMEYGKKYGYDKYFEKEILNWVLESSGGGNWKRKVLQRLNK